MKKFVALLIATLLIAIVTTSSMASTITSLEDALSSDSMSVTLDINGERYVQYIPKVFYQEFGVNRITRIDKEDLYLLYLYNDDTPIGAIVCPLLETLKVTRGEMQGYWIYLPLDALVITF